MYGKHVDMRQSAESLPNLRTKPLSHSIQLEGLVLAGGGLLMLQNSTLSTLRMVLK